MRRGSRSLQSYAGLARPMAGALLTGSVAEEMVGRTTQIQSDCQGELTGEGREKGTLG